MKSAKGKRKYRWVLQLMTDSGRWIRSAYAVIPSTRKRTEEAARYLQRTSQIRYRAWRVAVCSAHPAMSLSTILDEALVGGGK